MRLILSNSEKWMDRLEAMSMFLTAIDKGSLSERSRHPRKPTNSH
jgi:hypothetical protein